MKKTTLTHILRGSLIGLPYVALAFCGYQYLFNQPSSNQASEQQIMTVMVNETTPTQAELPTHPVKASHVEVTPNKTLLPQPFKVYYHSHLGLSHKAFKDAQEKVIPTSNEYTGEPGCYVACYSQTNQDGVYSVSANQYIVGQVRVQGHYHHNLCIPTGYEKKDLRKSHEFKERCEKTFPEKCDKATCRAGGYTAHWFYDH